MAYGTINADQIGTSVANTSLGAGNASAMKNRIINGAMVIDQRNAGASYTVPSGYNYCLDRWQITASQASKMTIQQNAGSVTPPTGFTNYLGVTSSSAYTAGTNESFYLSQKIEGYNVSDLGFGGASAKTVTVSFQVRSSLTGTFGGSLWNGNIDRLYPFTFTISSANTWTSISVTIAGDTTGTWTTNNGVGLYVNFVLACGSGVVGTAGSWQAGASNAYFPTGSTQVLGTNGATFYITGVQLEVGSIATGFDYRVYGTELANCQRYYQQGLYSTQPAIYFEVYSVSGIYPTGNVPFLTAMRAVPTTAFIGTQIYTNCSLYGFAASPNTAFVQLQATGTGRTSFNSGGSGGGYSLSAEL
jgi:hypothetical protein